MSTKFLRLAVGIDVAVFAGNESVDISILNAERSITRLVAESVRAVIVVSIELIEDSNIGARILNCLWRSLDNSID